MEFELQKRIQTSNIGKAHLGTSFADPKQTILWFIYCFGTICLMTSSCRKIENEFSAKMPGVTGIWPVTHHQHLMPLRPHDGQHFLFLAKLIKSFLQVRFVFLRLAGTYHRTYEERASLWEKTHHRTSRWTLSQVDLRCPALHVHRAVTHCTECTANYKLFVIIKLQ